jgi:ferredoxin
MARVPVIDLSGCTDCDGCVEICPDVFQRNDMLGYVEVAELEQYPEEDITEVINICPADCVGWEYI